MTPFAAGYQHFADWCRANGKKLCILANSGCLGNCPWQTYHDNLIAFPADWFEKTSACAHECSECGYCEKVLAECMKDLAGRDPRWTT